MVDDTDSAADVIQEVFTALFTCIQGGKTILYVNTWLYRTTINQCIKLLSQEKHHLDLDMLGDSPAEEEEPEIKEKQHIVQQALARMKPDERALLVLYGEGCSYREIADATGMRFASVGKTLSRALEKMEKQLNTIGYEMP